MPPKTKKSKTTMPPESPEEDESMEPSTDDNVAHILQEFEALKLTVAESRDNFEALMESRLETMISDMREELQGQINDNLEGTLTHPDTVELLREALHLDPYDSNDEEMMAERKRKKRLGPPVSLELQQLIHHHYHALLKKPHPKPFHWPELPKVLDEVGTVHHWPKPSADDAAQPVVLSIATIAAEDKTVRDAFKSGSDVKWPTDADGNLMQGNSRGRSAADPQIRGEQESDNELDAERPARQTIAVRTVNAWRPNWEKYGVQSSSLFREEVISLCNATITSVSDARRHSNEDVALQVHTYFRNIKKEYLAQMIAAKRGVQVQSDKKERRRRRSMRALKDRYDKIERSPLKQTANYSRIKAAITGTYAWMPDYLSDDDEDRLVRRPDLDERELYYRESTRQPKQYVKVKMWESREAFWMTKEASCRLNISKLATLLTRDYLQCRLAGVLLDEFVRKQKPNVTPVFRVPYDVSYKDVRLNPRWPTIRDADQDGRPKVDGKGFVIYRFMVDHARLRDLLGYEAWQEKLYPDPPEDSQVSASGSTITSCSLREACNNAAFANLGLWAEAKAQDLQFRYKRESDEVLEERYQRLTRSPATDEDDEEAMPTEF